MEIAKDQRCKMVKIDRELEKEIAEADVIDMECKVNSLKFTRDQAMVSSLAQIDFIE